MAYIAPNSTIKILANVPISPDQTNTLWFAPGGDQLAYFNSKVRMTFDAQSYQRATKNTCRLNVNADLVDDCNYMMFQNTAFSTKWFYAFITNVEYINTNVTEITYQIDDIQTWLFQYETPACFVERSHSSTDIIGENILPENVNCGEYVFNQSWDRLHSFNNCCIALMYANATAATPGVVLDGIFGGCETKIYHLDTTGRTALMTFIQTHSTELAAMVGLYMLPIDLLPSASFNDGDVIPETAAAKILTATAATLTGTETIDGYTPKNKKLYTYPYNFYHVDNCQGGALDLRYEFFDQLTPYFEMRGNMSTPVGVILVPGKYKVPSTNSNVCETVSISNFPMCSFSLDSFIAWLSQNLVPSVIKLAGGALGSAVSGAKSSDAAGSAINQVSNFIADGYSASVAGDIIRGNLYNGNTAFASNSMLFLGARCSVTADYAQMIDHYFTAYGYAQKKIMIPNPHQRSRFTYIKTVDCLVKGLIPAEAARNIAAAYNRGIRFWADTGPHCGDLNVDLYPNNLLS